MSDLRFPTLYGLNLIDGFINLLYTQPPDHAQPHQSVKSLILSSS